MPAPSAFRSIPKILAAGLTALLAAALPAQESKPGLLSTVTDDSAVWLPLYGERMMEYYHPDWQGWFPGGRSNRFHEQYAQGVWQRAPSTRDWQLLNRTYVPDGEWFAMEYFYRATYTADGFRQWEATLGVGRLKEGRLVLWMEFFDDSLGNLQRLRLMPLFGEQEPVYPWPVKAVLSLPYRP